MPRQDERKIPDWPGNNNVVNRNIVKAINMKSAKNKVTTR